MSFSNFPHTAVEIQNFVASWKYLKGRNFRGNSFPRIFFGHFAGINFRELGLSEDFAGIHFRELSLTKDFAGINFLESALFKDFAGPWFMDLRTISVKINTFLPMQITKQPMVSRRPNSKDTVSDRNSNIRISLILEKFCGN